MARILIGSIAPNIHGITSTAEIENDDELILYDSSADANRKAKLSDLISGIKEKITSIPYVCDYYDSPDFSKIKAASDEGRPVVMYYGGIFLQLMNCFDTSAQFYGFFTLQNAYLEYTCIKPVCAEVYSNGKTSMTQCKSYIPLPSILMVKLTESNGTISADKNDKDFLFAYTYNVPVEVEYNGLHYHMNTALYASGGTKFYAISVDENGVVLHELTYSNSDNTWSHRTI